MRPRGSGKKGRRMEGKWKPKKRANRNGWKEKKVEPLDDCWASFHESYKKEKHTGTKRRLAIYETKGWSYRGLRVGTYFQTIVKRVGAILTGHSDALTDSPKTKVATNHDRVIVVVVEIRRSFSFLTKIERFDSIERDEDCYKKTKRRKMDGFIQEKKGWGGERERERIKTENGDEITQLHAPRDKCRCTK